MACGDGAPTDVDASGPSSAVATAVLSASATSSSSVATDATGNPSGGSDATSTGSDLPEGCGDGVVEPGVYCYGPVEIEGIGDIRQSIAVDFDDDGREEFVIDAWTEMEAVHVEFDGERFVELARVTGGNFHEWSTQYDFDGDGSKDLLALHDDLGNGSITWYRNERGRLGELWQESLLPAAREGGAVWGFGIPAPIDVDADGSPEFVEGLYWGELGTPTGRAQLFRRVGEEFQPDGPPEKGWPLFGCSHVWYHALADLDEDGDEDLVVLDYSTACDPYPPEYDPDWYRFLVFLNEPSTQSLQLLGSFPTGAAQDGRVWARDIDADGHVDLLFDTRQLPESSSSGLAFYRGRGDATFDEPVVLEDLPTPGLRFDLQSVAQVDDDLQLELLVTAEEGLYVVEEPHSSAIWTEIWPRPPSVRGVGDVNGDGLDDILLLDIQPGIGDRPLALVSAP